MLQQSVEVNSFICQHLLQCLCELSNNNNFLQRGCFQHVWDKFCQIDETRRHLQNVQVRHNVTFAACSGDSLSIELLLSQQCLLELPTENPKEVSEMPKIMIKSFSSYFLRRCLLLPWPDNEAVRDLGRQLAPEHSTSDLSACLSQTQEPQHKISENATAETVCRVHQRLSDGGSTKPGDKFNFLLKFPTWSLLGPPPVGYLGPTTHWDVSRAAVEAEGCNTVCA